MLLLEEKCRPDNDRVVLEGLRGRRRKQTDRRADKQAPNSFSKAQSIAKPVERWEDKEREGWGGGVGREGGREGGRERVCERERESKKREREVKGKRKKDGGEMQRNDLLYGNDRDCQTCACFCGAARGQSGYIYSANPYYHRQIMPV